MSVTLELGVETHPGLLTHEVVRVGAGQAPWAGRGTGGLTQVRVLIVLALTLQPGLGVSADKFILHVGQVTEQPLVNVNVTGHVTLGVHVEDLVRFVQAVLSVSVNGGPVPLGVPGPDAVLVLSPAPEGGCLVLQHLIACRIVNFTRNISPQGWVRAKLFILIINSAIANDAVKFISGVSLAEPTFIQN